MAINFNYNKTIQQTTHLEEVANDLLLVANKKMAAAIDSIGAAWSGNTSKEFLKYFTQIQQDVRNKATYLQKTATAMREVAKTMKAAEDKTKALVSNGMARG